MIIYIYIHTYHRWGSEISFTFTYIISSIKKEPAFQKLGTGKLSLWDTLQDVQCLDVKA